MTVLPRDQFPVAERWRYFNHAAVSPLPQTAVDAVTEFARAFRDDGGQVLSEAYERVEAVRLAGASLMGVPSHAVAFTKNTTEGLAFVAAGLDWRPGDRVVVPTCEFPSNRSVWEALGDRGVTVIPVEPVGPSEVLPLDRFERALRGGDVRVVAVSWVQFARGFRVDLEGLAALCREYGALLCVDAIQGVGVVPAAFAAWGVDFAAVDAQKWMLGPEGIGFLYVRDQHLSSLRVLEPGWNSGPHRDDWEHLDFELDRTARRFEGGSPNALGTVAMGASLDLLLRAGIDDVWSHVDGLCRHLVGRAIEEELELLTDRTPGSESGIVTLAVAGCDGHEVAGRLRDDGFVVAARAGGIRVAPHAYNTVDEIDDLVAALTRFASPR